jgi:putative spermidine/putrescine transport system permease protein
MTARAAVRRRAPVDRVGWLALPAVAYLVVIYGWPLLALLARGVSDPTGFTLAPFAAFFADPFHWQVIFNTVKIAALVTLVCLLIGYPTAFALAWSAGWSQLVLLAAIILPLSVGVVVKAFAWQIVLRRDGVVSLAMVKLGIWSEPVRLLFTEAGLVLGATNVFIPFMILPIYSVVKLIDPRLNEAGATLGATPFYRFRHIVLPLTLPGVLTGVVFVFSLSIAMYVIPSLLIGDRFQTLATLIGRSFLFMRDERLGSTTALVLLALAVLVVAGSSMLANRLQRSQ